MKENTLIEVKSNGKITAKKGSNIRTPYEHQKNAMECLDVIDKEPSYSTLVVLPTGGGKTYTASLWLLKHAINRHKKILWLAHRQMLLDQAAESFQKYAYAENIPNVSSFTYRIVSGSNSHDRTIDIVESDNLLIASKDSLGRNLPALEKWLGDSKEVYLIIDEAHHSTAKTYRKIIDFVKNHVEDTKIIGLTATPFRTSENEQGLLAKIYTDGVLSGKVAKDNIGITYQIGLKELINRRILSKPIFDGLADAVVLVDAPRELRIRRVMELDGVSREQVQRRLEAQDLPLEKVNVTLSNSGSAEELSQAVDRVFFDKNSYLYKLLED